MPTMAAAATMSSASVFHLDCFGRTKYPISELMSSVSIFMDLLLVGFDL